MKLLSLYITLFGTIMCMGFFSIDIVHGSKKNAVNIEQHISTIKSTETKARNLILEVYKAQWNKVIKEIDQSLEKLNPNPKIRINSYTSIQKTLELRKKRVAKSQMSALARDIILEYLDYMLAAIQSRKKALQ